MRRLIVTAAAVLATLGPVPADGLLVPPHQAYPPLPPPPQPSQSCLMTALQMGYLTGRREVAYANTEACIAFTRSRGVVLPYEWPRYYPPAGYGPPPPYWNGRNGQ
jgi:hypothetical protein